MLARIVNPGCREVRATFPSRADGCFAREVMVCRFSIRRQCAETEPRLDAEAEFYVIQAVHRGIHILPKEQKMERVAASLLY